MILGNKTTNRLIFILLFLFSLNVFNQSSLILVFLFILVVVHDKGKLYIPGNDNVFFILLIFAIFFFLFSAQNGLASGISALGCFMSYYIGLRLQYIQLDRSQAEEQLKFLTLLLVTGMTCHAVVNFLYELIRFGGINSSATHYDFFSLGAKTSATGAATYLTLFAGVIFYLIIQSKTLKEWIIGIIVIVVAFMYDMILGGRTFFALVGVSFILSSIVYFLGQNNSIKKFKAIGKFILIIVIMIVAFILLFIRYQNIITKIFESTYLFHRISYANLSQSQDLLSFFKSSDRGNVRNQYILLMFDYPWGGRKILNKVGFYAHELWLDVFDSAGLIPFILIWIVTLQITFFNLKYILNKKVSIDIRVLLMGITASMTVQLFFEPVLTGCRTLFFSYLLISGLIKSQLLCQGTSVKTKC